MAISDLDNAVQEFKVALGARSTALEIKVNTDAELQLAQERAANAHASLQNADELVQQAKAAVVAAAEALAAE